MKEPRIHVNVSQKKHQAYKLACVKEGLRMREPLLKAVDKTIKESKK